MDKQSRTIPMGSAVHADRDATRMGDHSLWCHRVQPARVADVGAARLSQHVSQDRHGRGVGNRHLLRRPAVGDAGSHALYRRHGACVLWSAFPVLVHHDRMRCGVGFPFADFIRHNTEDGRTRIAYAPDRFRRDADGVVRRDHGAYGRVRARPGHLFRDERSARGHRQYGGRRGHRSFPAGASRLLRK